MFILFPQSLDSFLVIVDTQWFVGLNSFSGLFLDVLNKLDSSIFSDLYLPLLVFPSVLILSLTSSCEHRSEKSFSCLSGRLLPNMNYKEEWSFLVFCEVSFTNTLFTMYASFTAAKVFVFLGDNPAVTVIYINMFLSPVLMSSLT